MTERDAFLIAIAETPGNDVARLVYADWLDEQGEHDRAEFVRLHVRLRQQGHSDAVRRRLEEIKAARDSEWFGTPRVRPNRPDPPAPGFSYDLDGGLIDALCIRAPFDGWLDRLARLISSEPVRHLAIGSDWLPYTSYPGLFAAMNRWPQLARVRSLRVWASVEPAEMTLLGRNPHLTNLRSLDLAVGSATAVEALAEEPLVRQLTTLSIRYPEMEAGAGDGVASLAALINASRVQEQALGGLSERNTMALLGRISNPHLTGLDLKDCGLHDPALPVLAGCPVLGQLRSLNLRINYFSAGRLAEFFETDRLPALTRLRASNCISYEAESGRRVWTALSAARFRENLEFLEFAYRPGLEVRDLEGLTAEHWPRLESLSLGPARFGDHGLRALARSSIAGRLRELEMWDCGLTDQSAVILQEEDFPLLTRLNLRRNTLSAAARSLLSERFGASVLLDRPDDQA